MRLIADENISWRLKKIFSDWEMQSAKREHPFNILW
jgi:hypothetical protein